MELWVNEFWLFVTAVIFTVVGWYWGFKSTTINVVEATVDSLIADGYLKTRTDDNGNIEILKFNE